MLNATCHGEYTEESQTRCLFSLWQTIRLTTVGRLGRAVRKKLKQLLKAQHQIWFTSSASTNKHLVCDSSIYPSCCLLYFFLYFFSFFFFISSQERVRDEKWWTSWKSSKWTSYRKTFFLRWAAQIYHILVLPHTYLLTTLSIEYVLPIHMYTHIHK